MSCSIAGTGIRERDQSPGILSIYIGTVKQIYSVSSLHQTQPGKPGFTDATCASSHIGLPKVVWS
eukprot:221219-Amphidinium_carterae.1